jgi:hypothetical protein
MRSTFLATAALVLLAAGAAVAQQATLPAAPGASATRPGPRAGMGRDFTPGWTMMTRAERDAHRRQMLNARSAEECRRILDEHFKQMTERANARGVAMPGPRRDACASFRP